jgi:hypothetical protein
MNRKPNMLVIRLICILTCTLLSATMICKGGAQEERQKRFAGVDNTKVGNYRALAQLALQASKEGDNPRAAELGRILENSWDVAGFSDQNWPIGPNRQALQARVDSNMDGFINLLKQYREKRPSASVGPNPAEIQSAYDSYIESLDLADDYFDHVQPGWREFQQLVSSSDAELGKKLGSAH